MGAINVINSDVTLIGHFVRQIGKIVDTYRVVLIEWFICCVVGCTNCSGKEKALAKTGLVEEYRQERMESNPWFLFTRFPLLVLVCFLYMGH